MVIPGVLEKAGKRRLKVDDGAACEFMGLSDFDARAARSDGPGVGGMAPPRAARGSTLDDPTAGVGGIAVCEMEERAKSVVTLLSSSLSFGILTPSVVVGTSGGRNTRGAARVDALVNALMGSALVRSAFMFCDGNEGVAAGALILFVISGSVVPAGPDAEAPMLVGRPMGVGASSATSSSSSPSSGSGV